MGKEKTKSTYRTIDLFAGIGGMRLAFESAGFSTVFSNDIEKNCKKTYDSNFNKTPLHVEDINNLDISEIPSFDVLVAGFPCQAFSIAGYRQGFQDKKGRGNLFFRIADIISERKPKAILLENVKNLKCHDKGKTFKIIKKTLEELGYYIKFEVLNSRTHSNIPQNRERIFIVGFLDEQKYKNFRFPDKVSLTKNFKEFLIKDITEKYYYEGKPLHDRIKNDVISEELVYQWRRKYVRANKKGVVPTLTANMGRGGHNVPIIKTSKGIRKLTPRECFKLQGFPNDFQLPEELSDSELYHQAGNSVTVKVVERIAEEMKKVLDNFKVDKPSKV
jgi:DNA (cytosine-5)-methyltransferase 1